MYQSSVLSSPASSSNTGCNACDKLRILFSVFCAISRTSCRSACSGESAGICLSGSAQQRSNRRQHLAKLIMQFARNMPQCGFLRRNQFLRQVASLRRKAPPPAQTAAGCSGSNTSWSTQSPAKSPPGKNKPAAALARKFPQCVRGQLFRFVILHQQPRNRRTQCRLPRLQCIANLLARQLSLS